MRFQTNDSFRMTVTSGNNVAIKTAYTDQASVAHSAVVQSSGPAPVEVIPRAANGWNTITSITIENKDDAAQIVKLFSDGNGVLVTVTLSPQTVITYNGSSWGTAASLASSSSATPVAGQQYFDGKYLQIYDGANWQQVVTVKS